MSEQRFSDDNPKSNPWTDDELGFAPFARRLATSVRNLHSPNGYVIGLQGEWGSGKSTALNFVKSYINKDNEENGHLIDIIDFKPWIISGHQDLVESFFKILTEKLADTKDGWKKKGKQTLRVLRQNVDPIIDAAATVGMVLAPGVAAIGGKTATDIAKKSLGSHLDKWLAEPSLQAAYDQLYKKIEKRSERFLVIIDDIDRLTKSEIRLIMQMVKTVGRLPNVTYLLAYDRDIVWSALADEGSRTRPGPGFAEKIVQQEVELPVADRSALLSMLDRETAFLLASTPDNERWHNLVSYGIYRWIRHPRDVIRLSNALKFSGPALEDEIDPQDLITIEGIRLFDNMLFEWLKDNRDFIFGQGRFAFSRDDKSKKIIENLLIDFDQGWRSEVASLLATLFPTISKAIGDADYLIFGNESHYKTVNRRGIGSQAGYDSYFSLHAAKNAVPKRAIDFAFDESSTTDDQERNYGSVKEAEKTSKNSLSGEFFTNLQYRILSTHGIVVPQSLFMFLFKLGPIIQADDEDVGAFQFPPRVHLGLLFAEMCKATSDHKKSEYLKDAFQTAACVQFVAEFWVWRAAEHGIIRREGRTAEPVISRQLLNELHKILLDMIEVAAANGSIKQAPVLYDILSAWALNGNEDRVREWISENCQSDSGFLANVARGMLGHTVGSKPRAYTMYNRPDAKLYDITALYEASQLHENDPGLNEDERARVKAVLRGLKGIVEKDESPEAGEDPER